MRWRSWWLGAWLAAAVPAVAAPPSEPSQDERDEVVTALAESGQDLSLARLAALAGTSPRTPGEFRWHLAGRPAERCRLAARLRGGRAGFAGDLRAWRRQDGRTAAGGWGAWRGARGTILVGGWGWQAGYGLVAGAPGRRPGLTADTGLGPPNGGLRRWSQPEAVRAGRGAAAALHVGGLRFAVAVAPQGPGLVALGEQRGRWGLILTGTRNGASAAGIAGRWLADNWHGAWEAALPLAAGSAATPSVVLGLGWRLGRRLGIEGLAATAPGAPASPLAAPHPLLGPAGGVGWAVRATGRWTAGPRLALLVSRVRRRDGAPGPEFRHLGELLLAGRFAGNWSWEASWREIARSRLIWSTTSAWEPPTTVAGLERRSWALRLAYGDRGGAWRLVVKSLAVDGAGTIGRRRLAGLERTWRGAAGWSARGGHARAWGDPVDLVTVLVPVPGRILARHWGRWQSETWLGAALARGVWRLAASLLHRQGGAGTKPEAEWQVQVGLAW